MYGVVANYVCMSNFQLCYSPSTYNLQTSVHNPYINSTVSSTYLPNANCCQNLFMHFITILISA